MDPWDGADSFDLAEAFRPPLCAFGPFCPSGQHKKEKKLTKVEEWLKERAESSKAADEVSKRRPRVRSHGGNGFHIAALEDNGKLRLGEGTLTISHDDALRLRDFLNEFYGD
jgi:hypothetical protein